ncbi:MULTISPECIES: formate dehydrogenase subunit gamma [Pseudomonas]|uniref:Formate dehydrogenase subunit gamma n=1 Tax=Pseudomonas nitroreducens TaxID=46680 RepID=A0A6G6J4C0_PSENT|nr:MULTISPECIES: formate dehydrogenase subunit gamma [Pseudomonas]MCJ1881863.1 formate dehydrogenase subunit gamma [Pseudomonas nitroreducens]MCJ1898295.1 formate dehydrogenase subunit gamma [Pseudomonas nitroreducens]MDG9855471.1 formate dehydrogenase subunit gamma [Pseudomonas nitroreducens]MDH1072387.1 formate dehydrogenase subunit gamma [Pseudomonas nitroreducens]NMZ60423.1 formate dehydrogenase subunit gamma [Pseudomonas nitroreducens]
MKKDIQRYNANERSNHWMVAILFFLAGLSGLALFHPAMFWLTNLFGGGPWTRILHPFLGVAMFLFFLGLVIRFAHHNLVEKRDVQWLKQWRDVVTNREENLPEVGRYNAGQKLLFWTLLLCMLVLLVTGFVMWRAYFSHFFGIDIIRIASLLHAFAAFVLICSILVHIYAGLWVKGSMGAMLYGWVSRGWARKHHAAWLKDVDKGKGH